MIYMKKAINKMNYTNRMIKIATAIENLSDSNSLPKEIDYKNGTTPLNYIENQITKAHAEDVRKTGKQSNLSGAGAMLMDKVRRDIVSDSTASSKNYAQRVLTSAARRANYDNNSLTRGRTIDLYNEERGTTGTGLYQSARNAGGSLWKKLTN